MNNLFIILAAGNIACPVDDDNESSSNANLIDVCISSEGAPVKLHNANNICSNKGRIR